MHIYLVRHGQTHLNKKHIHQFPNTSLSEKGIEEALTTAECLREINPDLLVTSDYTRAIETARIIGRHTGLVPETSNLFFEIIRPSSLYGKSHFSFETLKYSLLSVLMRKNKDWRYKDSENMQDLIVRTKKAFEYMEKLSKKHSSIVIVSHSVFMNFLVAHMCNRSSLSFFELLFSFLKIKHTPNGFVIHLEYYDKQKDKTICAWKRIDK